MSFSTNLILPFFDSRQSVSVDDIVSLESNRNYTQFRFKDGHILTTAITLKRYEERLSHAPHFYRISKSCIINTNYIESYKALRGGFVKLSDGQCLSFSRRRVQGFISKFNQ